MIQSFKFSIFISAMALLLPLFAHGQESKVSLSLTVPELAILSVKENFLEITKNNPRGIVIEKENVQNSSSSIVENSTSQIKLETGSSYTIYQAL